MHELPRMVADEPIGKEVPVLVLRKGKEQTVTRQARPPRGGREGRRRRRADAGAPAKEPPPPPVVAGPLGLTLSDLSPAIRDQVRHQGRGHAASW